MDQPLTGLLATRLRGRTAALEFAQLTAGLAAHQSASATGVAATLLAQPAPAAPQPPQALAMLFAATSGWTGAVAALGGRFHPDVCCTPRVNRPATTMTGLFTVGFQASFKAPSLEGDIGTTNGSVTPGVR